MSFRCYWCDYDRFDVLMDGGVVIPLEEYFKGLESNPKAVAKDYVCKWCSHLASEPNPRSGDPEETVDSLKEERDELRQQLEACYGQAVEAQNPT